jgi:ABC-2 type transport system permease protein
VRLMRSPALAVPVIVLPVCLFALFALVLAGDAIAKDPSIGTYLFTSFAIMAVTMPALFGIGASLALDRDAGLLRLKRAQPAPAGAWLVAKIACGIAFGVLAYVPMLVLALTSGRLPLQGAQVVALSATLLAGAIPFCALGLMIGSLFGGSGAPGYANLVYLPGCYLSGMFFPMPKSMSWQVPIWPQFHLEQLAMHAAGVTKYQFVSATFSATVLVAYTVLFSAVAMGRLARKG